MEHRMILATADLSKIYKVVVARRKHATVAQVEERIFRTDEVGASIASAGSNFEEVQKETQWGE